MYSRARLLNNLCLSVVRTFDFIWILNISLAEQSSLASKSSTTSLQPCAPAEGCFNLSILSLTQSRGSIRSLLSPNHTSFLLQNRACASGDSQYDSLAISLALGLGLISADVKIDSAVGCADYCHFEDSCFVSNQRNQ